MDIVYHKGTETFVMKLDTRDFVVRKEFYGPSEPAIKAWEITNNGFRELPEEEAQSLGIPDTVTGNLPVIPVAKIRKRPGPKPGFKRQRQLAEAEA